MSRSIKVSEKDGAALLAKQAIHHARSRAGERKEQEHITIKTGRTYTFEVLGHPEPGGSKKAFVPLHPKTKKPYRREDGGIVVSVVDANDKVGPWRRHIKDTAFEVYRGPVFEGALRVEFVFYRKRPESHYGASGLNKQGRETPFPITKPDSLKLARAAEDALTGICWKDDAIIVKQSAEKFYGEPERVEITITELLVDTGQQSLL